MGKAIIDVRVLTAISAFASKEETRYYLNGVCIEVEPRAITYVATDGHRLVAHRADHREDEPDNDLLGSFIIPTAQCRAHKFQKNDERCVGEVEGDSKRLTISFDGIAISFDVIDGTFPDWRRVVPVQPLSGTPSQFNGKYAADFEKFGAVLGIGLPAIAHNGEGAALVWFSQGDNTVAVLMSIRRFDPTTRQPPAWATKLAEQAAA
jgi:DNA polymerase-3 subunit beta